ncbi:MAG: cytochrome c [Proteobacteria bacterium]|nr:cytochrome c [Pseudomonadota bacterium]
MRTAANKEGAGFHAPTGEIEVLMRPRRMSRFGACLLACVVNAGAFAASGQQIYATCAACHGARAEGDPGLGAPALAGQQVAYLQRQLLYFRTRLRGSHQDDSYGAQMRAGSQAALPDDKAIAAVVTYIAALPKTGVKPGGKFDARNGNNLYQGKCGACHGGRAEGNEALSAPRLAGLDAAYIKRQHRNFSKGLRGAQPQDRYGKQMALMAATLASERELDDVIGHIHAVGTVR